MISISYLGLLGIVALGIKGLVIALAAAVPISGFTMIIADKCGDLSGRLFLGPRSNRNIRDRLSGDLSRAKVQKMNGNYDEALQIIDNALKQAPDYNEALFIKAQILSDGLQAISEARKCLETILMTEPKDSVLYRWSMNLRNGLKDASEIK